MSNSKIEWTDTTWNPTTGCTKISPGCKYCYAESFSKRLKSMGIEKYKNGFEITLHDDVLDLPLQWKKPRFVFVDSMSDLFHEKVPLEFIKQIFSTMHEAKQHKYQILTKRSDRMLKLSKELDWTSNIWLGVSVENNDYIHRINHLRKTNAQVKFISFEPLIGPITNLDLTNIDWVIVGGESGPGARPMKKIWVEQIRNKCISERIPFFFKQWGGTIKKRNGRELDGRTWEEKPLEIPINY